MTGYVTDLAGYVTNLEAELAEAQAEVARLREDAEASDELWQLQAKILDEVAVALKGPQPRNGLHDLSDLGEWARSAAHGGEARMLNRYHARAKVAEKALAERDAEIDRLRALLPREPRVWFEGDDVPAGVWTYRVEKEWRDEEDAIEMLDPDEPCGNGNLGPLVEIVLPADIDGIVERARRERDAAAEDGVA